MSSINLTSLNSNIQTSLPPTQTDSPIIPLPLPQAVHLNHDPIKNKVTALSPLPKEQIDEKQTYLPYPSSLCQSPQNLLALFKSNDPNKISELFPHDSFSTFINCLHPFLMSCSLEYLEPMVVDQLLKRIQAFFYPNTQPKELLDGLKNHIQEWLIPAKNYEESKIVPCSDKRHDTVAPTAAWKYAEDLLVCESEIMNEVVKKRQDSLEHYGEYVKLLHLKFRNAIYTGIKKHKVHLYPIPKKSWDKLKSNNLLKKCALNDLNDTALQSTLKNKNQTHFIYIVELNPESGTKEIKYLNSLKSSNDPSVQEAGESMIAALKLMQIIDPTTVDKGFGKWLQSKRTVVPVLNATMCPNVHHLWLLCDLMTNPSQLNQTPVHDGTTPWAFNIIFQIRLDILISNWTQNQPNMLAFIRKGRLEQDPINKVHEPSPVPPAKPKSTPQKKQSYLKKFANTVQHTAKIVKNVASPKPILKPCSVQTLQEQLVRPTCNIPSPHTKRLETLPGKEPQFQKHPRVSKWEQQTVKFLDPFSMELEEELLQHIFHIPHPLVDRFVHLGIKGIREGLDCITIPAEFTINEMTFKGSVGYTFTSGGLCFHRHFTKNTIEEQKKEAVSYVHFPEIGHANAKSLPSVYVANYGCRITQDKAGNVTLQHTQVAYYSGEKREYPVSIKLLNVH